MKKRYRLSLLVPLVLLGLIGCSPESETDYRQSPDGEGSSSYVESESSGASVVAGGEQNESNTPIYETGYDSSAYFYHKGSGTFLRYNKITGTATSVCPDPLCSHEDESCDFFTNVSSFHSSFENTIYYTRTLKSEWQLWKYEIESQKVEKLFTAYGMLTSLSAVKDGCYFLDVYTNSDTKQCSVFYYVDSAGKVRKLTEREGNYSLYFVRDERIYFVDVQTKENYSCDRNGEDWASFDTATMRPQVDKYTFYQEYKSTEGTFRNVSLMRVDNQTGETVELLKNCGAYTIHNDRIYYLELLREPPIIGKITRTENNYYTNRYGGLLYSMDLNGEDKQVVIDNPELDIQTLPSFVDATLMDSRYLGIQLNYFEEVSDGLKLDANRSMLIYDTQTGEYKVSVYEP